MKIKKLEIKTKSKLWDKEQNIKKTIFALTPKMHELHCVVCMTMLKNVQNQKHDACRATTHEDEWTQILKSHLSDSGDLKINDKLKI